MSNTGRKKKLASFNCDQRKWEQFIACCNSKGTTATATLLEFIELYLGDSQDKVDAIGGNDLDERLDSKIKRMFEKGRLEPQVRLRGGISNPKTPILS
ncbi:hypothetical protein LC613_41580 [Nostoc sphaeroides CHAB 2801]|uniref:hypothetical protein n=1 Tax=Nostoc sphaeroides TaxID=446679 RepID=UPI001E312E4A|nr:hypothetical protein [Nostoc sphaeroides]MCC5633908.1 hypothetical protein [Nostoc sphaeroides CHAB 2801]